MDLETPSNYTSIGFTLPMLAILRSWSFWDGGNVTLLEIVCDLQPSDKEVTVWITWMVFCCEKSKTWIFQMYHLPKKNRPKEVGDWSPLFLGFGERGHVTKTYVFFFWKDYTQKKYMAKNLYFKKIAIIKLLRLFGNPQNLRRDSVMEKNNVEKMHCFFQSPTDKLRDPSSHSPWHQTPWKSKLTIK